MLIFAMIFLFTATISSKTNKIKCMEKINSRNKFQFLNVDNFEIILKFLNFDDLPYFVRACDKSKSDYLKQTIRKLFQTFHKKKIQKSIEYINSETFHLKQQLPYGKTNFFEKYYLNLQKTIQLPKFMDHVIQTPKFRIISHIDGFLSIEQKLENQKQYSIVSIHKLFYQRYSNNVNFIKLSSVKFSLKNFIAFILNHHNNIFILFQEGQIFICGKTGNFRACFQNNKPSTIFHFMSRNNTYYMSYLETTNDFVIYHISSGEIFCFMNSSLRSIFLNPNSNLDYDFLKKNGKSSGFVNPTEFLLSQMSTHICVLNCKILNPNN